MKATFIRDLTDWHSDAQLWELSEPVRNPSLAWEDEADVDWIETKYVIVSAAQVTFDGPETYIFPATEDGKAIRMLELPGSTRGILDHHAVLRNLGCEEINE